MIAVLGATGTIGRSLARHLAAGLRPLALYARNPGRLADEAWPAHVELRALADLDAGPFSLVVNALGAGDPARVAAMGADILDVTQAWDARVLATMGPDTRYVFLSSGAIYGAGFGAPVTAEAQLSLPVNRLETVPPYTASKLVAEIRHRNDPGRAILDLRVFGYADPAIPLDGTFFLAELARSVVRGTPFVTSPADMVRDYAGAAELAALIAAWEMAGAPNTALDLYTRAPVSKSALLELAASRYGLDIRYTGGASAGQASPTGTKAVYASAHHAAAALGYAPARDSAGVVTDMLDALRP